MQLSVSFSFGKWEWIFRLLIVEMDSKTRWQFNPFDQVQPLRQQENSQQQNLPRSGSLNEIREQQRRPVRVWIFFRC